MEITADIFSLHVRASQSEKYNKMDDKGEKEWQYGLFGCFGDIGLCIITFCVPCYTIGKNAEHFGESCGTVGALYCIGFNMGPVLTWRLRQQRGIRGSMVEDTVIGFCCPCCELIREGREIKDGGAPYVTTADMARS